MAEREAAKIAGEWMRDNADTFVHDAILKVEIYDEERRQLASISITIERPSTIVPMTR